MRPDNGWRDMLLLCIMAELALMQVPLYQIADALRR